MDPQRADYSDPDPPPRWYHSLPLLTVVVMLGTAIIAVTYIYIEMTCFTFRD